MPELINVKRNSKVFNYPPEVLWLREKKPALNMLFIEREIGAPSKTLYNFCIGYVSLNEKWWKPVQEWVKKHTTIKPIEK